MRDLYEAPSVLLFAHYQEIVEWLGINLETLQIGDKKALADRYHWHLRAGKLSLKEQNLLPAISKGDRTKVVAPPLPISIYLDHIRSAHNVGSIIRTTEALSLGRLCFSTDTPFADHVQVVKTAMGAEVECVRDANLAKLPRPIIALETSVEAISLYDFIFPEEFTLVLGNEEYGCSDESLRLADHVVEIPLFGKKNSLNVANAFAIVAGEIRRSLRKSL